LDANSVFVVTGAAGSIVSAITADLAAASGGTFYLLDLVPEPDPANPDLQRFNTDKDGLKREIAGRIQARGERATPVLIEKELAGLERARAALTAIEAVQAAGGTAHWFSVNLTDGDAVSAVIERIRERSGHIDVLLHAAGLERSHFLPDKDPRQFDLVFDVKADGWFHLLHAIGDMPLGAAVAFSSIAGRFGNGGQTDYSSANDLLCKSISSFRTTRPATRGIAIDWTAWGGIGMASRGSIPKMMEMAGIDMLAPEAGIPLIRRELTSGGTSGEVVVAERLGILLRELDENGGLQPAELSGRGPMIGTVASMSMLGLLRIETTLDPAVQPFLNDHRIEGTPVLPGVMGTEAFAEAAACLLPGWHVNAVEKVDFMAPFKFYRDEPRTVTVEAMLYADGEDVLADCRLIGTRHVASQTEPQVTTHFTGTVRMRKSAAEPVSEAPPRLTGTMLADAAGIYSVYFHGPAYQVLDEVWQDEERVVGLMAASLPDNHRPADQPVLVAPRLIELCFQTAGISEIHSSARMGLPLHIDRVVVCRAPELADGRFYAVVTPAQADGGFDADVVDSAGNVYIRLGGYRTVALPGTVDTAPLQAMHAVAH
jgi:NAD(P)-dependent dehydrogenase (short-subunit alcohol dehydrogenase family)